MFLMFTIATALTLFVRVLAKDSTQWFCVDSFPFTLELYIRSVTFDELIVLRIIAYPQDPPSPGMVFGVKGNHKKPTAARPRASPSG